MRRGLDPHKGAQGRAAVLALDLISDFTFPDGVTVRRALASRANAITALLKRARRTGVPVIYCNDNPGMWTGANGSKATVSAPATAILQQAAQGIGVPIAIERGETAAPERLRIFAPTIDGNIARKHSEYYEGVSPRIAWSAVKGAKSFAVIMEDPDAKPITPFVHWLAWNIPADHRHLAEGLQEQPRLLDPLGTLQGRTSRGSVGYFGPRPPVGDPPHRYHFQVFALDTMLDVPFGAERDELLAAMQGHVLAAGELVGTYQQTIPPLK